MYIFIYVHKGNGGVLQRPARDYQEINERLRAKNRLINSKNNDDDVVLDDDGSDINESDDNESSVTVVDDEVVASNVTVGDVNSNKM
jgi:hypothetical protein